MRLYCFVVRFLMLLQLTFMGKHHLSNLHHLRQTLITREFYQLNDFHSDTGLMNKVHPLPYQ